jgi:hypothetical protein
MKVPRFASWVRGASGMFVGEPDRAVRPAAMAVAPAAGKSQGNCPVAVAPEPCKHAHPTGCERSAR